MKLELAEFPVKQIRIGHRFAYADQIPHVDEGALLALVLEDSRITDASLAVAAPGERRASPAFAISSSREIKYPAADKYFPACFVRSRMSVKDDPSAVGHDGDRCRRYEGTIRAGTTVQRSAILDMSGPGAEFRVSARYVHLVLSFKIVPGFGELDAHRAIQLAEFKVACRLAQMTEGLAPVKSRNLRSD